MRPNLMEYWWRNESAQIAKRAETAAAVRDARLGNRSRHPGGTHRLLGTFARARRIVTVTPTGENRG